MSRDRIVFRSSDAGALPPTQVLRYGAPSLDCPGDHRRNHRWKVAGDLAWGEYRSTSFSSSRPSQSPVISHPRFTHSDPYSPFLLHLSSARRSGLLSTLPSEPKTASCKSCGGDRTHLVPVISRIGGDASHGAAAPMLVMTQCSS